MDLNELIAKGCAPKLYYSKVTGLEFGRQGSVDPTDTRIHDTGFEGWDSDYNLTNGAVWQQVPEGEIRQGVWYVPETINVTAIAVDAQKSTRDSSYFELRAGQKASVYLHMRAPSDGSNPDCWNAKGAYAHKTDHASSSDDIDWVAAQDPANNMYAYNAATVVFVPFSAPSSGSPNGMVQNRQVLNYEYDRVGIVPETITVRKIWKDSAYLSGTGNVDNYDGLRPDSVTVRLKGVTGSSTSPVIEDSMVLSADNGWEGTFLNAPETDSAGNHYTYTVTEDPVPGYTAKISRTSAQNRRSYEIVNTHEKESVDVTVQKLWLNPDGTPAEPPDKTITLYVSKIGKNGPGDTAYGITLNKGNNWTGTITFDRYEVGGFEYQFAVSSERGLSSSDGWFSQLDPVPAGITVTADYDPDDIHTFRNFKKPDFGYALIYDYVKDSSKPGEGNHAQLPAFTFAVELKDGDDRTVTGKYEYIVYNKIPEHTDLDVPADAAQVGRGTISSGGTITLEQDQCAVIIGIPDGTYCSVEEQLDAGWSTSEWDNTISRRIRTGATGKFVFGNTYKATGPITITGTKWLRGREQKAREFSFGLTDNNRYDRGGYENEKYGEEIAVVKTGQSRGCITENGVKTGQALFTFTPEYDSSHEYEINEYGGTSTLKYTAKEKNPEDAQEVDGVVTYNNVIYDTRTLDVTVTFTDRMDGTLDVDVTTTGGPLAFTNSYIPQKTQVALTAHKELIGRTLQAEEFSFEVRRKGAPADSAPIATGKNDADGNITFTPAIPLSENDIPGITLLISEVQGTDPTVAYMQTPVETEVKLAQKEDGELLTALPGQEIKYTEITCPTCGGTGELGSFSAVMVDTVAKQAGEIINLSSFFNADHMNICTACNGTGWAPNSTGIPCSSCNGKGTVFKDCTHPNFNAEDNYCPDCLYGQFTAKAIHTPNGLVLLEYPLYGYDLNAFCGKLGIDPATFPASASYNVLLVYTFTEEHWAEAVKIKSLFNSTIDGGALVYLLEGATDNICPVCHGNKVVLGDPYVDGDALPVQLVNYLKTEVSFTAEKTLEGQPASEPFTFVLLETDEERRTEKEIARTQNGTDGKIAFEPVALNPATPQTYYYIIREVADAENSTIAYDTGEDIYKVTVSLDNDGIPVVDKKLMSGDGVFRNTYKGGSLEIEVKTGGHIPRWPWWQPPKFPVNVVLKDCEGRPLAGYPLPTSTQKVQLSAKAGNGMLTVSDVMTRAESTAGNVTDSEGRGTIMIEGGSVATITGLPDGATYEASQPADSMPKGYSQGSAEGTTGTIRAGQVSKATFENNYQGEEGEEPVPTSEQPKPSAEPTPSDKPTDEPTVKPTDEPTVKPTDAPTAKPTEETTANPTETPKVTPTAAPAPTDTPKPQPVPKTGDTDNPMLWVGLILIGLIGIGGLAYGKYRKKK